jgi:hypothetical protein
MIDRLRTFNNALGIWDRAIPNIYDLSIDCFCDLIGSNLDGLRCTGYDLIGREKDRCHKTLPIELCNNIFNEKSGEWEAVRSREFFCDGSNFDPVKCMWMSVSFDNLIFNCKTKLWEVVAFSEVTRRWTSTSYENVIFCDNEITGPSVCSYKRPMWKNCLLDVRNQNEEEPWLSSILQELKYNYSQNYYYVGKILESENPYYKRQEELRKIYYDEKKAVEKMKEKMKENKRNDEQRKSDENSIRTNVLNRCWDEELGSISSSEEFLNSIKKDFALTILDDWGKSPTFFSSESSLSPITESLTECGILNEEDKELNEHLKGFIDREGRRQKSFM